VRSPWRQCDEHFAPWAAQVQCITHFLRLPIEDDFLDQLEDSERGAALPPKAAAGKGDGGANGGLPPDQAPPMRIPFAKERNPIMSQVQSHSCCHKTGDPYHRDPLQQHIAQINVSTGTPERGGRPTFGRACLPYNTNSVDPANNSIWRADSLTFYPYPHF